jgi:hypothetical protein
MGPSTCEVKFFTVEEEGSGRRPAMVKVKIKVKLSCA